MKKQIASLSLAIIMAASLATTALALPENASYYAPAKQASIQYLASNDAKTETFEEFIIRNIENLVDEVDISAYIFSNNWTAEYAMHAYQEVVKNNTYLFYVFPSIRYTQRGDVYKLTDINYIYDKAKIPGMIKKFNAAVDKVLEQIDDNMTDMEKALTVHDYLAVNNTYDTKLQKYDAYNALVDKTSVCQGYAYAYQHIMKDKLGIECDVVTSDEMEHAWNYIKIDNKWYHVDVTADDPTTDMHGLVQHTFFLVSDKSIANANNGMPHFDMNVQGHPKATSTKYDKAFWHSITSPIVVDNGNWYYAKQDLNLSCAAAKKDGRRVCTHISKYVPKAGKIYTLTAFGDAWTKLGTTSYFLDIYSTVAINGDHLYFNTPTKIFDYNLKTKKMATVGGTSGKYGCIYGFTFNNNKIIYTVRPEPLSKQKLFGITLKAK